MRKNNYVVYESTNICGPRTYSIYQSKKEEEDKCTDLSQTHVFKEISVGSLTKIGKSCSFVSEEVRNLELILYEQHLSIADTYKRQMFKYCRTFLGLHPCGHEVIVATPKRVTIGKIFKNGSCCGGNFIDILDGDEKIIYKIQSTCCQAAKVIPRFLSLFGCNKFALYEIFNAKNEIVGKIQVFPESCLSGAKRYQIQLPQQAETKSKILLMNSLAFLF